MGPGGFGGDGGRAGGALLQGGALEEGQPVVPQLQTLGPLGLPCRALQGTETQKHPGEHSQVTQSCDRDTETAR